MKTYADCLNKSEELRARYLIDITPRQIAIAHGILSSVDEKVRQKAAKLTSTLELWDYVDELPNGNFEEAGSMIQVVLERILEVAKTQEEFNEVYNFAHAYGHDNVAQTAIRKICEM